MKASLAVCLLLIACAASSPATYRFQLGGNNSGASGEGYEVPSGTYSVDELNDILNASGDDDSKAADIEASLNNAANNGGDIGSAAESLLKLAGSGGSGANVAINALSNLAQSGNPNIYDALLNAADRILKAGFNLPNAIFEAFEKIPGFSQIIDLFGGPDHFVGGAVNSAFKGISDTGSKLTDAAYDFLKADPKGGVKGVVNSVKAAVKTVGNTAGSFIGAHGQPQGSSEEY